jgi:beta-phosphoglucomutase family hydrolase
MPLGLPDHVRACLFDLDGVLTSTASIHAAAWREMFDGYLRQRAAREGQPFVPFSGHDYDTYVDGKRREDGTRSFLEYRGITLPEGSPDDPPGAETVHGLANAKNEILQRKLETGGVAAYPGSVRYLHEVKKAGLASAVVSSSANATAVLAAAGLDGLVDLVVDGIVAAREHLAGKPAPDTFLAAASQLSVPPAGGAVFEDALAGVEAGRAGGFGCVIGVDRAGQAAALRAHGAGVVVTDLAELLDRP